MAPCRPFVVLRSDLAATGAVLPSLLVPASPAAYVSHAVVKISALAQVRSIPTALPPPYSRAFYPRFRSHSHFGLKLKPGDVMGVAEEGRIAMLAKLLLGDVQQQIPVNAIEEALRSSVKITASSKSSIDIDAMAATPRLQRVLSITRRPGRQDCRRRTGEPGITGGPKRTSRTRYRRRRVDGVPDAQRQRHRFRIQNLQQSLHEADATTAALGQKEHDLAQVVTKVSSMKADDVLTKALRTLAPFDALASVRDNYTTAKLALDDVNVDHGPKHPAPLQRKARSMPLGPPRCPHCAGLWKASKAN